jgi:trk system potassium uptake protein TrkH
MIRTYSSLRIEKTIISAFLSVIIAGALLLWIFNLRHAPLSLLDALFTSTSAVCVTGLVVVDTGSALSPASRWIVLLLIQLGGLGIMTTAAAAMLFLGQKIQLRQRLFVTGGLGIDTPAGAVRLLLKIIRITLFVEAAAVIPLFLAFRRSFPAGEAFFHAIFHSVSAFCNAGFSTLPAGLEGYATGYLLPGTIMLLIVSGGLGFLVISDILMFFRRRTRLSAHSWLVLKATWILIAAGTALLLLTDFNGGLAPFSSPLKIWNALFQSVTARTAGFNTVPMTAISHGGLFILCFLMIIGASPGSTGGGIKTTTAGLLAGAALSEIRGVKMVVRNNSIPDSNIRRALAVTVLYLSTVFLGTILLILVEELPFKELLFEAISAMGTVGLSLGATSSLSASGRIVVILLMFWGRVGILTFMYGMISREVKASKISYAETNIPVG